MYNKSNCNLSICLLYYFVCYIVREFLIKGKTTLSGKTTVAEEAGWREKTQYSEISNLNYFDEGLANTTFKV